jgi:lactoylglutathione lyase
MPVYSLFETHLNVRDLGRSIAFYTNVVGLECAHVDQQRQVAFFWIGGHGHTMLGLWSGGSAPNAMRLHIAFRVDHQTVLASPSALKLAGIDPLDFYGEVTDQPSVIGWMPAVSVYFADPDDHLLEYLAMLPDEPRPDIGVVTYSEWIERKS